MNRAAVHVPIDRFEFTHDGWTFGQPSESVQPGTTVPDTLASLADMLRPKFRLWNMIVKEVEDKQEVYDAYGHDVKLLNDTFAALEATLTAAIGASVTFSDSKRTQAEQSWRRQELVTIAKKACLEGEGIRTFGLNYMLASKEVVSLVTELKQELELCFARGLQRLALRLKALVDHECLGVVTWSDVDVCCYHYFLQEERDTESLVERLTEEDARFLRMIGKSEVKRQTFHIRRVHHLVNARLCDLDAYQGVVPKRVRDFLDTIPAEVRHLFQVVDGQLTQQDEVIKLTGEETVPIRAIEGIYEKDPAITIGDYVLVGWGPKEVKAELAERWEVLKGKLANTGLCVLFATLCLAIIGGMFYAVAWHKAAKARTDAAALVVAQEKYDAFLVEAPGDKVVAKKGEKLRLGVPLDVTFASSKRCDLPYKEHSQCYAVLLRIGAREHVTHLPSLPDGSGAYGPVDLHSLIGLPAELRVLSADEETMEYVVIPKKSTDTEVEASQTK